jgi:hypothetical protein
MLSLPKTSNPPPRVWLLVVQPTFLVRAATLSKRVLPTFLTPSTLSLLGVLYVYFP